MVKFFFESGAEGTLQSTAAKVFIRCCQQNKFSDVKKCLELGVDANMNSDDGQWSGKKQEAICMYPRIKFYEYFL